MGLMTLINDNFKSGFVTILGRPNVGKSTFLNKVIGSKIAIMSDKPQTTRNTILGVLTNDEYQIIFTDTPGIHKPQSQLGRLLNEDAYNAARNVEAILFMVSSIEPKGKGDLMIIEHLKHYKNPIYLVVNKADLLDSTSDANNIINSYLEEFNFEKTFLISAKTGEGVEQLVSEVSKTLPLGPKYYPDDMITDHPERFIVEELIREKCFYLTSEEVPHSVAVIVDSMKQLADEDKVEIYATIYVERDSQKGIILGKNGALIKKIKDLSKRDIKRLLGSSVDLNLWVKVSKDWTDRPEKMKRLGYVKDEY